MLDFRNKWSTQDGMSSSLAFPKPPSQNGFNMCSSGLKYAPIVSIKRFCLQQALLAYQGVIN